MNIYFDQILECTTQTPLHIGIDWHERYPILAVASYSTDTGGFISFYNEGILVSKATVPGEGKATKINAIKWHPHRKLLGVACEGGEIYSWNDHNQEFLPSVAQHDCSVSVLEWSPCGSRLITADTLGALVGWKVDTRGQLDVVFHHELKDRLSHIDFKGSRSEITPKDIGGLARAAVNGDERALNMFDTFQTRSSLSLPANDLSFYIGSESGIIYYVNADGSCMEVAPPSYPISCLLYNSTNDFLVVVNQMPAIVQYKGSTDGSLEEITMVKLAGRGQEMQALWAGSGTLALTIGEFAVRMWDLINGDSYTLTLNSNLLRSIAEHVTALSYSERSQTLVAGTNLGNLQLWRYTAKSEEIRSDPEQQWLPIGSCTIKGAIKQLKWDSLETNIAVNMSTNVYLLKSREASCCFNENITLVQLSADRLALEWHSGKSSVEFEFETDIQAQGAFVTAGNVAVWSGEKIVVYEINKEAARVQQIGAFPSVSSAVKLHEQSVYAIESGKIQVRTFQGTVKQTLSFLENEGEVIDLDIYGTFLVAATSTGMLKLWEISRREAKPLTNPKSLGDYTKDGDRIHSIKVNCKGTKVSILLTRNKRLIIWDVETDSFFESDLQETTPSNEDKLKTDLVKWPKTHYWDPEEPRLLACEVVSTSLKDDRSSGTTNDGVQIISMFITSEYGIAIQDAISLQREKHSHLIGVKVPNYYFVRKRESEGDDKISKSGLIDKVIMRDFVGLDDGDGGDPSTKDAMMSFSFHMTVGNMDEAFKSIKKLKSEKLWESMARMCVKTKRLDVAAVCLGHMGHVRGTRALRECAEEPELDARVGVLATQLGMLDEAEKLFKNCGRYDLLNKFYQASNQWKKALETAETNDRIHLRATYYNLAKYYEAKGDTAAAVTNYERSETYRFEVPRMLFDDLPALERYISGRQDRKLLLWWAQFMESSREMETALQFYEKANDYLSLVRVYCYCNNLEKAAEIANETGDRAACYHLGRQYENNGAIKEAVHFFTRALAFNNAIRICKEQGMEDQLFNLALMAGPTEMRDVARHYESDPDQVEKAVTLYHKAGLVGKAIEVAFKSNQHAAIEQLAYQLDERVDPSSLRRCATFFLTSGKPDKAMDLLAKAKEYFEAVSLCTEHNIPLTEEMAESLTPSKEAMDQATRSRLLESIAECCYQQGNYHLATKKFTQAGNKIKAMKALLKSGDTERIVFFANVSRQREIYIMAANYLQTLDWRNDPEIMKNIVLFYTKGKALDLLAGFYDACAQVEIDEFQNYTKALGALNEACKSMTNANVKNTNLKEEKLRQLQVKRELVRKFVDARRIYEEDETEAMNVCSVLLKEDNLEAGVRSGDIYGFMVEHYARQQNYKMAFSIIEEMRQRLPSVNLAFYIDSATLTAIHRNLEMPYHNSTYILNQTSKDSILRRNGTFNGEAESDEEVAEDVPDGS